MRRDIIDEGYSHVAFPHRACRWSEVTRHLELWVQLMELNEAGQFTTVEVLPAKDIRTGGIFQLRQVSSTIFTTVTTNTICNCVLFF